MGTVIEMQVRCPKCVDGTVYHGRFPFECLYCGGESRVPASVAVAIREVDREMYAAFWCECEVPSDEVRICREGIYCAVCNKMVQEEKVS